VPSTQRSTAFGKYLTSFSKHISKPDDVQDLPSISRQRLHLVYVLNDLFHHAKHHITNNTCRNDISLVLHPFLPDLFGYAASGQKRNTCSRLNDVVNIWLHESYITKDVERQLRSAISDPTSTNSAAAADAATQKTPAQSKELPYLMPSTHGDPSLPFYELPAGNFIPHIISNRTGAMRPESIRPRHFASGPADESLVNAVKVFLKDVERLDDTFAMEDEGAVADIDDLGQLSYRSEVGEVTDETYYGWSKRFCEEMKSRKKPNTNGSALRSRSRSYSSSRSSSPRRKRRYSRSSSDQSRSRSRYRDRRFSEDRYRDEPDVRIPSRSRSPEPAPRFMPSVDAQPTQMSHQQQIPYQPPPAIARIDSFTHTSAPPFHPPPLLPGNIPVPPPRPLNWPAGSPWPPPPPPPPGAMGTGFSHAPFPPPPPDLHGQPPGSAFPGKNVASRYYGQ
jgi:CID domain